MCVFVVSTKILILLSEDIFQKWKAFLWFKEVVLRLAIELGLGFGGWRKG